MKVKMNVERVREALENPEHSGLSEVELAVLAAMVDVGGEEEQRTQQPKKLKRKPRPTRIKKGKRK